MKTIFDNIRNTLRNLLKIRKKRRIPPVGSRPAVNTYIYRGNLKMLVTHEMDDAMWQWLSLQNWRKISVPKDRRSYHLLSRQALRALLKASSDDLESEHARILTTRSKSSSM